MPPVRLFCQMQVVSSSSGLSRTILGGATPAEANYVTTDGNFSVYARSPNNAVLGNFFGLATDDLTPLSTAGFQIYAQRGGNISQGNRIANTTSAGIWVDGAQANTIRRNSIYANPFKGIFLENGGNNDLPAPVITLNSAGGTGTACPNCVIELFLDAGNQGRLYLDSVSTDFERVVQFPLLLSAVLRKSDRNRNRHPGEYIPVL